ncbi:response regulator [bacterium]|nr:MAG: response regulator [bacterium]
MSNPFHKLLIRQKLIVIIMAVTTAALIVVATAFVAYDVVSHRIMLEEEIKVLAAITGNNCNAALRFDDAEGAKNVLSNLNSHHSITAAAVFSADNKLFAKYQRAENTDTELPEMHAGNPGVYWFGGFMWVIQPIRSHDSDIGSIALQTDLHSIDDILLQDSMVVAALFLLACIAAFLLASKLQRIIVTPIISLAETAKQVSLTKNYKLHAPHYYEDEVADLTNAFNEMLEEIEKRETSLKTYRDQLENLVEERTHKLKETNELLQSEIVEREKTQEKLIEAKEEAEKANRLKSQFLANMSHELRTPMNSILGFSNILMRYKDGKVREFAETISRSGKRLMVLIDDVLDLSKVEAGKTHICRNVFLLKNLESIQDTIAPLLQDKPVKFSMHFDPNLPESIYSDETKVIQVLTNLVSNAIKFTHSGSVKVDCEFREVENKILFTVKDTGIGIKPEYLDLIFEEFYQINRDKNKQTGSGLGLAICKQIVEALGGDLQVESVFGQGSIFRFTVNTDSAPKQISVRETVKSDFQRSLDVGGRPADYGHGKNSKLILIAEDEETNQKLYHEILRNFDYHIVGDGRAALEWCRQEKPDVVLMDIMMPVMNGEEALKNIRSDPKLQSIHVIAVTAKAMVGDRESLLAQGFDDYLSKPIDEVALKSKLKKYGITPWYDSTEDDEIKTTLSNGEIITKIDMLMKLKFFQSREIKSVLESLSGATSGALQKEMQALLRTYRSRNESLFYAEVSRLKETLSISKEM